MRVEILDEAEEDLVDGARFYEAQGRGWASTFWTRCSPTSTRCSCMPESIQCILAIIDFSPSASPMRSTIESRAALPRSGQSSIAGRIRRGSQNDYDKLESFHHCR
jgi:hypothetical protein